MSAQTEGVPLDLQAHLDTACTTLAHCWRVTRRDGQVLGFTDHDRPLQFDSVTFDPQTGAESSEVQSRTGLAVDNSEIGGALLSEGLAEDDLAAGIYDGAKVETWLVNWASPDQRVLIASGHFGAIKRLDGAWQVEVRGLGDELAQTRERRFSRRCDARLGDQRCGVNLSAPGRKATATVQSRDGTTLGLAGAQLANFAAGSFTHGRVRRAGGAVFHDIAAHWLSAGQTMVTVWAGTAVSLQPGDTVELTVGCDKSWSTCRNRFGNGNRFRGFPHIPGNDFAMSVAKEDQIHDASPLVVDND